MVVHQLSCFVEVWRAVCDAEFGCGVEFSDEALVVLRRGFVDNGNGHVFDILIVIYEAEDDGIEQRGEEEDEEHHPVAEHAPHFNA